MIQNIKLKDSDIAAELKKRGRKSKAYQQGFLDGAKWGESETWPIKALFSPGGSNPFSAVCLTRRTLRIITNE